MSLTEQIAYITEKFPDAVDAIRAEAYKDALCPQLPKFDDNDEVIAHE